MVRKICVRLAQSIGVSGWVSFDARIMKSIVQPVVVRDGVRNRGDQRAREVHCAALMRTVEILRPSICQGLAIPCGRADGTNFIGSGASCGILPAVRETTDVSEASLIPLRPRIVHLHAPLLGLQSQTINSPGSTRDASKACRAPVLRYGRDMPGCVAQALPCRHAGGGQRNRREAPRPFGGYPRTPSGIAPPGPLRQACCERIAAHDPPCPRARGAARRAGRR